MSELRVKRKITALILAAGKSTRIKTPIPKSLIELGGKPIVFYVIDTLKELKGEVCEIIVVLGHRKEEIENTIKAHYKDIKFVYQPQLNGTAKAVEIAKSHVHNPDILIICADTPLIKSSTLRKLLRTYYKHSAAGVVLTTKLGYDNDLGRIIRDEQGRISGIVEKTNYGKFKNIDEVNSGIYCFKRDILFNNLKKIKENPRKKEYYLTDIIDIFYKQNLKVTSYCLNDFTQVIGINKPQDLEKVRKILNETLLDRLIQRGVIIIDRATTFVSYNTKIGEGSIVYPFTFIEKDVIIGKNCRIGPFVRIRAKSRIRDNVSIGNFIEINRSHIKTRAKMKHFGYLGDTTVGENTNIGAGVVVANYDGKNKNPTFIGKNCFIGSDTIIVAPVKIKSGALTGAGSVVTKDVEANSVVVGVPAKFIRKREHNKIKK